MPVLKGKCLTEQSPAPGAELPALGRGNEPKGGVRKQRQRG